MKRKQIVVFIVVIFITLLTTYGYAALNTELQFSGEAYVRIETDIRITEIKLVSSVGASELFQSNYSKDTVTMGVSLENAGSSLVYEYTIVNRTNEDYVIADITTSNSNANVTYTNSATERTIIPANFTRTFRISISTSAANQVANLAVQFQFRKDEVTAPVLRGGSNSWVTTDSTIIVATPGTATSGVKWYEYAVLSEKKDPGETVSGTINGNLVIQDEGTSYVYYRTVSNTGKKSAWSGWRVVNIDRQTPVLAMGEASSYDMSDTTPIASATFGPGGGSTKCVNSTTGSTANVTTFKDIKGFGKYTISCTATGNNGETASLSKTYAMGGTLNASFGLSCKNNAGSICVKNGTSWTVSPHYIQFGPYLQAIKGCYKVTYSGSGFHTTQSFEAYQNAPKISYKLLSFNITSTKVIYYVDVAQTTTGSGIEFVLRNNSTTTAIVSSIKVESVNTCPSS